MWVTLIKWYDRGLDAGMEGMHVLWIANKDASRFTVSSLGDGIAQRSRADDSNIVQEKLSHTTIYSRSMPEEIDDVRLAFQEFFFFTNRICNKVAHDLAKQVPACIMYATHAQIEDMARNSGVYICE